MRCFLHRISLQASESGLRKLKGVLFGTVFKSLGLLFTEDQPACEESFSFCFEKRRTLVFDDEFTAVLNDLQSAIAAAKPVTATGISACVH